MKKSMLLLTICLNFTLGFSQKNENVFNSNFRDIAFTGQNDYLLRKISLAGLLLGVDDYKWHVDNEPIFKDVPLEEDNSIFMDNNHISQLNQAFHYEFFPPLTKDTTIQLQAKSSHFIYFNLNFTKNNGKETFMISLPDNSCSKEVNYQNGEFESMFIVNKDNRIVIQDEKVGTNAIFTTKFYTSSRSFSNMERFYTNGLLTKKIYYKSSKNKDKRNIKETVVYTYDTSGRVISKIRSGNSYVKDSTKYIYEGTHLKSIFKYQNEQEFISYNYKGNNLSDFIYKSFSRTVEVFFSYGKDNKLQSERIDDGSNVIWSRVYEYNSNSQLISLKVFSSLRDHTEMDMEGQSVFTYFDNRILKSYTLTDKDNTILKETNYIQK